MPSRVPAPPEDVCIVLNHYGEYGLAFAETDLYRADYETTISDLISGQHNDPLRVIMFNPDVHYSEDVSHAVARELLRRLGLEGRPVPSALVQALSHVLDPETWEPPSQTFYKLGARPLPSPSGRQH